MSEQMPPAGWYPDPSGAPGQRYWDGGRWTERIVYKVDAYSELVSAETALREVVRIAVPNWLDDFGTAEIEKFEKKRSEEDARRDGIAVSRDLLDYTEIYQLQKIINTHWDPAVRAVLANKKRTDVYFEIILDVRNAISHPRPVYTSERLLLAGAAGQIRNQLAVYRASADGPHRHYPSIDSARDDMGNAAEIGSHRLTGLYTESSSLPRLSIGDVVEFTLEATDPRGRALIWRIYSLDRSDYATSITRQFDRAIAELTGNRVSYLWTVSEADYGENHQIVVTVANSGRFHRESHWDDVCLFTYHINPPNDS